MASAKTATLAKFGLGGVVLTILTAVVTTLTATTGTITTLDSTTAEIATLSGTTINVLSPNGIINALTVESVTISGSTLRAASTMSGGSTLTLSPLGNSPTFKVLCPKAGGVIGTMTVTATGTVLKTCN